MSPVQREELAIAYERGDGTAVANSMGEAVANLPMAGGAGTVKTIGKNVGKAADDEAEIAVLAKRLDVERIVNVPAGAKDNWDPAINIGTTGTLHAKTAYVLDTGHMYVTDALGRVSKVEGTLSLDKMDRNPYQQACAGQSGCAGDGGGHLIASSLGGAGDRINIVPQAATLSRGSWKAMENDLRRELQAGKPVKVSIEVGYPARGSNRPNHFEVTMTVEGKSTVLEFDQ
jgi:filamentous hemagglutinin